MWSETTTSQHVAIVREDVQAGRFLVLRTLGLHALRGPFLRALALRRCAIAIGSEGRGLTEQVLALCDRTVRIPMEAHCESLNAAMAAAVLLWEAYR